MIRIAAAVAEAIFEFGCRYRGQGNHITGRVRPLQWLRIRAAEAFTATFRAESARLIEVPRNSRTNESVSSR